MKCIEYTLRRQDAPEMIPWIRKNFPDLYVFVGSTLDDDRIIAGMCHRHPQLLTIAQLAKLDVHGFVSMIGWSFQSLQQHSDRYVIAPLAMTVTEAFQQVAAGAHFIKVTGPDLSMVKRCRADAAFEYCPVFVTGGMTPERIPSAIEAGAVLIGTGFDVTLQDHEKDITNDEVAQVMQQYLTIVHCART